EARKMLDGVVWCENAYETMQGADALVILTEWNEFRALDQRRVKSLLKAPILIDLRNVYMPEEMIAAGFTYVCIGRPGSVVRAAEAAAEKPAAE
ncbi:MAG: UDP-glucose dehydrogenase, partial [Rhodospirillales bacterium]|nr:UDP-glucose dehydrogenase [Rhodospirillales bacterium]